MELHASCIMGAAQKAAHIRAVGDAFVVEFSRPRRRGAKRGRQDFQKKGMAGQEWWHAVAGRLQRHVSPHS